jgi:predicted deacylase
MRRVREREGAWVAGAAVLIALTGFLLVLGFVGRAERAGPSSRPRPASPSPTPSSAATPVGVGRPAPRPTLEPVPTATARPWFAGPLTYGTSFDGWPLRAYRLGRGPSARAIVGGLHGGYEWNTVALVSDTLAYFHAHPEKVPPAVTLYLIPCANPDGYRAGTDAVVGRMNGNGVDLNRNWDYRWQMTATHGTRPVRAGAYPFSEPETAALRDFLQAREVEAVLFYHSAFDGVIFSSVAPAGTASRALAEALAPVVGYEHQPEGIPGQVTTGDAIDWLAVQGVAAVELELTTHQRVDEAEWRANLRGTLVFLRWSPPPVGE